MKLNPKHDSAQFLTLTDELSGCTPAMVEIDAQLVELARNAPIPMGLSERVFAASALRLPSGNYQFASAPMRGMRKPWFRSISGQLAMVASVALAFGIAFWVVLRTNSDATAKTNAEAEFALARALQPSSPAFEGQFDYLIDTNELNSTEDITSELAMLVRELEM